MGYKIKEIVLNDELFSRYKIVSNGEGESEENKKLHNLSKINIFIGTNNSGKSRFIRYLFEKEFRFIPTGPKFEEINRFIRERHEDIKSLFQRNGYEEVNNVKPDLEGYKPISSVISKNKLLEPFYNDVEKLVKMHDGGSPIEIPNFHGVRPDMRRFAQEARNLGKEIKEGLSEQLNLSVDFEYQVDKTYIPTLRGLRQIAQTDQEDPYRKKTHADYFQKSGDVKSKIFTGYELNNEVKELLLGTLKERSIIASFQSYLSKEFFNGRPITLLPSLKDETLRIKIGDEEEKPIQELGDGIQSLIILTFPLFINQDKNLLVFFEEPELFLHPGLQRLFIETLLNPQFSNFQYFIATHSNHFLDITLDVDSISIYTFNKFFKDEIGDEKPAYFQVENVSNEDSNVLDLIGVKNSSVFLSNCTIWVEGITDRYYLRKYLEVYQNSLGDGGPQYREDTHYSFVEYSGGNITHWSFLEDEEAEEIHQPIVVKRICSRIFLISDQDNGKEKRHEKLTEKLGDNYYCLKGREIENLLSVDVLLKVIAEYERVEVSKLKFEFELTEENYRQVLLGRFIDENLLDKKRKGNYASESGTVSDKVSFCKKAIQHIDKLEALSEEAKKLCEKIYAFVKANNP